MSSSGLTRGSLYENLDFSLGILDFALGILEFLVEILEFLVILA